VRKEEGNNYYKNFMNKSYKASLSIVLFICLYVSNNIYAQSSVTNSKPNILLIFADDLGYMDVGYNGTDYYETPNIDKLAKEGMVFKNAYAGGANCAPSRACLISGQYTPRHEVYAVGTTLKGPPKFMRLAPVPNNTDLANSNFTIAEALKSAGYATGIFGKWHLGDAADKTDPASQGFDVVMESGPAAKDNKIRVTNDPKGIFEKTNAACKFITDNKDKPFFAYVSHNAVHSPHQAREESLKKFKAKAPGKYHKDALYAACIYDLDESVGQLIAHLKKLGLDKNTLVIFTSDNGGTNITPQEPLRGNKGAFYEGGIREAFIARWPGKITAGTVNTTPIINLDLYPTFAALGQVKLPSDKILDGENLLPLFTGKQTKTIRDKIFWHFPGYLQRPVIRGRDSLFRTRPVTTMRKGDFKVLLYHEEWILDGGWDKRQTNNAVELYDLKTDEGERNNIASSNPQKRDELLTDILAWMKKTKAKMATIKTAEQEKNMRKAMGKNKKSQDDDDN
jgi:arylsulfatase A-like enzyme